MNHKTDNWAEVQETCRQALTETICRYIEECRQKEHPDSHLIAVLHKVQEHFGHLGPAQLNAVAQLMQIPTAKVTGVATFYHFFHLKPRGKYVINICMGTACYVKGAGQVLDKLKEELGIAAGETTKDGLFTLQEQRCLGTCGLAPVLLINDTVFANVTPERIPLILQDLISRL